MVSAVTAGLFIFIYVMLNNYIELNSFGAFGSFFLTIAIVLINGISFTSSFLASSYALQSLLNNGGEKAIRVFSFITLGLSLVFLGVNIWLLTDMISIVTA